MPITLHILKASGKLIKFEKEIKKSFKIGLVNVQKKIKLPSVDVVITDDAYSTIPETGFGGMSPFAHLLYIYIDPEFKNIEKFLDFEIRSTLAHELNHCARWHSVGYGKTLLEAIISEGLADHFDIEINGGEPKPWSINIKGKNLEKIKLLAKKEFFNKNYDHSAWFYGTDKNKIPRWAGYSLGYAIVGDYLRKTGKKASELVNTKAKLFI